MSITQEGKLELINKFGTSENDTGSAEVQCAILTTRINNLTEHFKANPKDFNSRRGLLILVSRRKRLIEYLKKKSFRRYEDLIKRLNLRK